MSASDGDGAFDRRETDGSLMLFRVLTVSMNKLKAGLAAAAGLVVGVVTLRTVRRRRASPRDEAMTAADEALAETKEAAEHAAAAVGHARVAGEKALEYAREELETVDVDVEADEERALSEPVRRLRRAGNR